MNDRSLGPLALMALSVPVMLILKACKGDGAGLSLAKVEEIVLAEMAEAPRRKLGFRR